MTQYILIVLLVAFTCLCTVRETDGGENDSRALGDKCSPDEEDECDTPNASCRPKLKKEGKGICTCDAGYYANRTHDQCIQAGGVYTPVQLAIVALTSFIAGVLLVLLIVLLCWLRSHGKLCFSEKKVTTGGKWEGASNSVTLKVIQKHSVKEQKYEDLVFESSVNASSTKGTADSLHGLEENSYECLSEVDEPEHTYEGIANRVISTNAEQTKNKLTTSNPTLNVAGSEDIFPDLRQRSSNVYEAERESNISEHAYFSLQNENFRLSNVTEGQGQNKAIHEQQHNDENKDHVDTDDTGNYFVLEKDASQKNKDDTSTSDTDLTKANDASDNNYFVLQKEGNESP